LALPSDNVAPPSPAASEGEVEVDVAAAAESRHVAVRERDLPPTAKLGAVWVAAAPLTRFGASDAAGAEIHRRGCSRYRDGAVSVLTLPEIIISIITATGTTTPKQEGGKPGRRIAGWDDDDWDGTTTPDVSRMTMEGGVFSELPFFDRNGCGAWGVTLPRGM
jgi:hypothetical protein